MNTDEIPATLPNRRRLSDMLSGVGNSFRSGEAYDAAWIAGHDVSERTLRKDLKKAADAGILNRLTTQTWEKTPSGAPEADAPEADGRRDVETEGREAEAAQPAAQPAAPTAQPAAQPAPPLRTRIACALLAAGEWSDVYGTDRKAYVGPTPEELADAVERYARALEDAAESH